MKSPVSPSSYTLYTCYMNIAFYIKCDSILLLIAISFPMCWEVALASTQLISVAVLPNPSSGRIPCAASHHRSACDSSCRSGAPCIDRARPTDPSEATPVSLNVRTGSSFWAARAANGTCWPLFHVHLIMARSMLFDPLLCFSQAAGASFVRQAHGLERTLWASARPRGPPADVPRESMRRANDNPG